MTARRFKLIKQGDLLSDLDDLDLTGVTSGNTIVYNGTSWVVGDHGSLGGLADNDHSQYLLAASYTAADVLAKLLTVDGAGSGLDADLLDGNSSAFFLPATSYLGANPTASVGLTAVNGVATTYMRSDAAPALNQSISPTWTGVHTFNANPLINAASCKLRFAPPDAAADAGRWQLLTSSQRFRLFATNDAENAFGLALDISHGAGGALGGIFTFGNTTNNVSYSFLGTGTTIHGGPVRLKGYTVATLPAGTQGNTAFVTDALAPAFGAAVVGGGAVVIPVFYDGTNWIVG